MPVFLDLKMHDIPETVDRAVARACALGVKVLTVHASGGPLMLERAASRAAQENTGLWIAAVTVLTSLDAADLANIGVGTTPAEHVKRLGRMAFDTGVRAFICSPLEASVLRAELGESAVLVTPGVRLTGAGDDQKRVETPARAIHAGADAVVVGRPIRDASDPVLAARAIASDIAQALPK
jgi:orotidine-5'-phosphate decarboxylase